jgi:hypothetical protein
MTKTSSSPRKAPPSLPVHNPVPVPAPNPQQPDPQRAPIPAAPLRPVVQPPPLGSEL